MAISEKKGQGWTERYINLNPGRLFVPQPPRKGNGSRSSFKLLYYHLQKEDNYHTTRQN